MFSRFGVGLALSVLLCALPQAWANAAITATPVLIDHTVEARDIFSETITLTNTASVPLRLFASVHEITLSEGGGIESFVPASMSDRAVSVTSWIAIDRGRLQVAPGESITLPVNFRVNHNAAPGLYHAFIGFGTGSNRDEAEAKTLAGQSEGVLVRLAINDTRTEQLRLARFTVDRFVTTAADNTLTYAVSNPGDIGLVPEGEVVLYNARGEEVGAFPINAGKREIAPGETVDFTESGLPEGLFGKYKAFLRLEYGAQRAAVHDTAFFYAAPIEYLVGLFVTLFAVVMGFLLLWRKRFSGAVSHDDSDGQVAMYIRTDSISDSKEHDINLKGSA